MMPGNGLSKIDRETLRRTANSLYKMSKMMEEHICDECKSKINKDHGWAQFRRSIHMVYKYADNWRIGPGGRFVLDKERE